jgi:hypothetical protein
MIGGVILVPLDSKVLVTHGGIGRVDDYDRGITS